MAGIGKLTRDQSWRVSVLASCTCLGLLSRTATYIASRRKGSCAAGTFRGFQTLPDCFLPEP